MELDYDVEEGYHMGVYMCLGNQIHEVDVKDAIPYINLGSYDAIHKYVGLHGKILVYMGSGKHKIKKKAEQLACEEAILKK